ncbi:uncharacterized protein F5891DRAFT_1187393 [Suillus fuscotomentosus]|uniref:Uncharacterized protein n=1 Tax=Suillus fuscotomentosus TaxID=1912939 RepID=A0AAD4E8W5_9AGAM|nr:uncharacterized protein F5891DRAFT_1187393 [Suillus fuscotomentosus]KAG1901532.1 hypothetical protein F5891DRAFT_1187393 [Suillus fuscotomentosus]
MSAVPGSTAKSSRGSTQMAKGINVSCTYLQDEQGNPVSAQCAKAIRQLMLSSFCQLETQGLTPESISQASLQVLHWLTHMLCKQFLKLHLCADNWKSMKLMIDNYSQWYNYHVKRRGMKRIKSEDIPLAGDELCESSVDTLPSISTSDPLSSSNYLDLMIDPALQEPPTKKQKLKDAENTTSEALPQLEIPLSPAEIDEPALPSLSLANEKQTETLNVEVKNPLQDLYSNPQPQHPLHLLPSHPGLPGCRHGVTGHREHRHKDRKYDFEHTACQDTLAKLEANKLALIPLISSNICALEWQKNGHHMKEEYKSKATAQAHSSSTQQAIDGEDAINVDE